MLNFDFLEKGPGIVSSPHFVYDLSRKMFVMLHIANWPNFITSWDIGNMCILIACFAGCDVIKFEINLIFLIKHFFYMTKTPGQKCKYHENENSF